MEITLSYLLFIIFIILIVLVILIIFEGRTNRRINTLMREIGDLRKDLKRQQQFGASSSVLKSQKSSKKEPLQKMAPENNTPIRTLQTKEQQEAITNKLNYKEKKPNPVKEIMEKTGAGKYIGEEFVGENIINKIGIIVFVLGTAYFVKYAVENDWINSIGRVAVGIFSSGVLVALAHQIRHSFRAFSSVLLGGAMASLYFTFALAFHQYGLLSVNMAFGVMMGITIFSVLLSLVYDRLEIATLAALAGFTAPFFVDYGVENYKILLTYILILDIGMLIIAYFKKWMILNLITIVFTGIFYALWLGNALLSHAEIPYFGAFIFATIFYLIFFLLMIINNVRKQRKFIPIELSLIISVTVMYYTAGMIIVQELNDDLKGLFTAMVAIVNFIHLLVLYRNPKTDRNLIFLLLGLFIVFTTLIPPVQLVGKSITMIWSLQIVLLMWLAQKIDVVMMKLGSTLMTVAMLGSLIMDMHDIYVHATSLKAEKMAVVFNQGFLTNLLAVAALVTNLLLLKNEKGTYFVPFVKVKALQGFLGAAAFIAFYFSIYLEIKYHLIQNVDFDATIAISMGIFNLAFLMLFTLPSLLKDLKILHIVSGAIGTVAIFIYLFYYHSQVITVRNAFLMSNDATLAQHRLHYAIAAIVLVINAISVRGWLKAHGANSITGKLGLWFGVFVLVFILSSELDHYIVVRDYKEGFLPTHILQKSHKLAYTILWGTIAFVLTIAGIISRFKNLRVVAITLLLVTFVKLFIFDLGSLDEQGQVIAFVSLGFMSLVISFLYQRLHNMLFERKST